MMYYRPVKFANQPINTMTANDNLPAGYKEPEPVYYCDCGEEITEHEMEHVGVCCHCR